MPSYLFVSNYTRKHLEGIWFPGLHIASVPDQRAFSSFLPRANWRKATPASSIALLSSPIARCQIAERAFRTRTLASRDIDFLFVRFVVPNRIQFWTTNISVSTQRKSAPLCAVTLSTQKIVDITTCMFVFLYLRTSFETCTVLVKDITELPEAVFCLKHLYVGHINAETKVLRVGTASLFSKRKVPFHDLFAVNYPITQDYDMLKSYLTFTASSAVQHAPPEAVPVSGTGLWHTYEYT